jgi:hypothetical protein
MTYNCNICNKSYKYRQNLYRHKKKCNITGNEVESISNDINVYPNDIHNDIQNDIQSVSKCIQQKRDTIITFKCNYCDKEYKYRSGKYKHQKSCSKKYEEKETYTKENMEQTIDKLKAEMLEMFNKQFKMHHKTFDKLQRDLEKINANNTTNNLTNNNTTNNTTNNNLTNNNNLTINNNNTINIIPLGKENFVDILDKEDQKRVVNSLFDSIKHLCNITHFNPDTPQYHSFIITNNQNNIAHIFDDKENKFKVVTKDELLFDLIHERGCDIRDFIEVNEGEIKKPVCRRVNDFIDKLDTDRRYYKKHSNELKALIYSNTRDKDPMLVIKE